MKVNEMKSRVHLCSKSPHYYQPKNIAASLAKFSTIFWSFLIVDNIVQYFAKFHEISQNFMKFHHINLCFCSILVYFLKFQYCFQRFQKFSAKFWSHLDWFKIRKILDLAIVKVKKVNITVTWFKLAYFAMVVTTCGYKFLL
jgi:hypothetical protein